MTARHRLPARFVTPAPAPAPAVESIPPAFVDADVAAGRQLVDAVDRHLAATPAELLQGAVRAELLSDDWRAATLATRAAGADQDGEPAGWPDGDVDVVVALVDDDAPAFDRATLDELLDGHVDEVYDGAGRLVAFVDDDEDLADDVDAVEDRQAAGEAAAALVELGAAMSAHADEHDRLEGSQDGYDGRRGASQDGNGGPIYGWASAHDARSLEFAVRDELAHRAPVQDRVWLGGPVLDQARTDDELPTARRGACTGYASAAAWNAGAGGFPGAGGYLDDGDAADLYLDAQRHDHLSGEDYAGTSVLAAMDAGRRKGLWDAYLWAFGVRDVAQAILQVGPVVIGVPWFAGMETTDGDGVVEVAGDPVGGHAVAVVGILKTYVGRPGPWFVLQNSRGTSWGDEGLGYLHVDDLRALLRGKGEAAIPIVAARRPTN